MLQRTRFNDHIIEHDGHDITDEEMDLLDAMDMKRSLENEPYVLNYAQQRSVLTDHEQLLKEAMNNPLLCQRELCKRDLSEFIRTFWNCITHDELHWNWHIDVLADELMQVAQRVGEWLPREHDIIFNVPPGTTKSITCSIMFPVWCWTNWPWMRFITASYSNALSLEHADYSRDLIRSPQFKRLFPDLVIKEDRDTKSNYRIQYTDRNGSRHLGGNRYSTSVGGTLTGFHGHILIVDDPMNPREAVSELKLNSANHWMEQTLSTRKVDKAITPTVLIMQRLHEDDPAGHLLAKKKENLRHICLPGELEHFQQFVKPQELVEKYQDGLLDPNRMPKKVLRDLETDLGQYGYSGQIGQNPVPPGGGMFHVGQFIFIEELPPLSQIVKTVRYWDKAGTQGGGAYTVGVKMSQLKSGKFVISDVKRGQWATEERERIIRETAEEDGVRVMEFHEQEPGSGGKESAQATIRNLAGFVTHADRPTGDKVFRADPYSVQVNNSNVMLLRAVWNSDFISEHRFYPFSKFKDQVDASAGAFNNLARKRLVQRVF